MLILIKGEERVVAAHVVFADAPVQHRGNNVWRVSDIGRNRTVGPILTVTKDVTGTVTRDKQIITASKPNLVTSWKGQDRTRSKDVSRLRWHHTTKDVTSDMLASRTVDHTVTKLVSWQKYSYQFFVEAENYNLGTLNSDFVYVKYGYPNGARVDNGAFKATYHYDTGVGWEWYEYGYNAILCSSLIANGATQWTMAEAGPSAVIGNAGVSGIGTSEAQRYLRYLFYVTMKDELTTWNCITLRTACTGSQTFNLRVTVRRNVAGFNTGEIVAQSSWVPCTPDTNWNDRTFTF